MVYEPFRGRNYVREVVLQTAAQWAVTGNKVLQAYETGRETDTGLEKTGDGVTAWESLPYNPVSVGSRTVTNADATAALTDNGGIIYMNSSSAHSVTFPAACKVKNFNCLIVALGTTAPSTVGTTNVDGLTSLSGQYAIASVIYSVDADKFIISGSLA